MLFLLFHVGADRFVIDAASVVEVLPLVYWKHVPEAPVGVVGIMNYHHAPVPVVDVSMRIIGRPSSTQMSTRIVLIDTRSSLPRTGGTPAEPSLIGLVAERVAGTVRLDPAAFVPPDTLVATVVHLGPLLTDAHGIIQRVEIEQLLPPEARVRVLEQCTNEI